MKIGVVLQYEDYVNRAGEEKERLQVTGVYSADYIRQGKFKVPPRADKRQPEPFAKEPGNESGAAGIFFDHPAAADGFNF